jgi:hypothetical protein
MIEVGRGGVTITDADCSHDETVEPAPTCDDLDILIAVATNTLTPEQCVWLHNTAHPWEISVERERR